MSAGFTARLTASSVSQRTDYQPDRSPISPVQTRGTALSNDEKSVGSKRILIAWTCAPQQLKCQRRQAARFQTVATTGQHRIIGGTPLGTDRGPCRARAQAVLCAVKIWRRKWLQVPSSGSIRQRDMGLFSLQAAVAGTCLSTSRLLSGPVYVHSTRDKPSSTRSRAIEAKSPRLILGSSSGILLLSVAGAAGSGVSDDYLSRNRLQIHLGFRMRRRCG